MARVQSIAIVGAGPAGLILALLLAKSGIQNLRIRLLEREAGPTNQTRAVFFMPVSQFEFERAGILEDVKAAAFIGRSAGFRDQTDPQKLLFEIPSKEALALTSDKLAAITEKHLAQQTGVDVKILWSHKAVGVGQDSDKAWLEYESPEGNGRLEADYVVGCDGGGSFVRRALLGEKALTGFTWDDQLVAVDVSRLLPQIQAYRNGWLLRLTCISCTTISTASA
jgi:2-polyprenyl-6-methoxyphenol hydroxylase-like FAD-dependent oxidoreductase